jgi:hypothetical protein
MFQPPPSSAVNLHLLATLVMSVLLIGAAIAFTWQQHRSSRVNFFSKKLAGVYSALVVGLCLLSLQLQPHFHEISQTCKDYQLQTTLYSSTPANPGCDREIADSEAAYLAAYPLFANQQSSLGYLGLLALAGGVFFALQGRGDVRRTRRGILRPGTLRNI